MSKFTEVPYNILESFIKLQQPYGHINSSPSGISNAMITNHHITAKGGFGVDLYLKKDKAYYKLKCRPIEGYPDDNQFLFNLETDCYRNSEISDLTDYVGDEIYFREESLFYDFIDHFIYRYTTVSSLDSWHVIHNLSGIKNQITPDDLMVYCYDNNGNFLHDAVVTEVDNNSLIITFDAPHSGSAYIFSTNRLQKYYMNTNRLHIYFGQLYISDADSFSILYNGMKDYSLNILPVNNRTDKIKELLKLYFDYIYNNIYYQIKDVHTLSDPYEVDYNYLYYIALMYRMSLLDDITDVKQREYVSSLPYLLKRGGTYTSIHGIWKLLMNNSSNLLNIYERWHDWNIPSDIPLPYFTDYPYYDLPLYLVQSGSQLISDDRYIHTQETASIQWHIEHNLRDYNLFVQCFDVDGNMVYPASYEFISDTIININFGEAFSGYAYIALADVSTPQLTKSMLWNINHALNSQYVLNQVIIDDEFENIVFPLSVTMDTSNNYTIKFATAESGTSLSNLSDYTHEQTVASTEWTISHNFGAKDIQVQFFDSNDELLYPINIQLFDDYCLATFVDDQSGVAVVKSFSATGNINDPAYNREFGVYPTYDEDQSVLSPHYRVEMDLTYEPLGENYILDETTYNTLITGWESIRPVSRFAHYSVLIAPVADFTGIYKGLYDPAYMAKMNTVCTIVDDYLSSETTFGMYKVTSSYVWRIKHNLNTLFTITQCYDTNGYRIEPRSIETIDENNIHIYFDEPSNGYSYTSVVDDTFEQETPSGTWLVEHNLDNEYNIVQFDSSADLDYITFMPGSVTILDNNTYLMSTESSASSAGGTSLSGYVVTKINEYIHTQTEESDIWLITHELGSKSVIVNIYDLNNEMIQPSSIYIINDNSCRIVFDEPTSGYAVLKGVDVISIDTNYIITQLSYTKIGIGTTGIKYDTDLNDLEVPLTGTWSVSRNSDRTYYYIKSIIKYDLGDIEITEIGLFDLNNDMIFYNTCSPIYLKSGSELTVIFRIEKL